MGITYQTPNRLRRKVMTAPLTLPVETVAAPAPAPAPMPPVANRKLWWTATGAGIVTLAAALLAARAF